MALIFQFGSNVFRIILILLTLNLDSVEVLAQVVVGQGFPQPPTADCIVKTPRLSVKASALKAVARGVRAMDVGLDRQSFLDRGWTEQQLGRFPNKTESLFLSMYYALQLGDPNPPTHPWSEQVHNWDRGLTAHIDYYLNEQHGQHFSMYAYDHAKPPTRRAILVGRRSTEPPFTTVCKGSNVIGCAGASDKIYIRTDYSYALGYRLDDSAHILKDGRYFVNISYLISHEAGHFFGLPHVNDPGGIMYYQLGAQPKQHWHHSSLETQRLLRELAHRLRWNPI